MKSHFDIEFLESTTEKLRAIAHPLRLVLIDLLYKSGEMTVTEIYENLEIEQAVASHHLRIMKNQDIVKVSRSGKNSLYALTKPEYYFVVKSMIDSQ
ncbi:MAG: helix-turn-helix transcriptional regulator [Saprospiraceae bacterium]|nr:helix-turn-helix transcriptional regulator [Saprospiraceae bacterium]